MLPASGPGLGVPSSPRAARATDVLWGLTDRLDGPAQARHASTAK